MEPNSVLAVGAHPDDVEINCSGTLKQLQQLGIRIEIATMTLGDCGSASLTREAIAKQRRQEAENACALLGARYHWCGANDLSIFNDDHHNRLVTALLRETVPDIVFTHSPSDYLVDHETTSTLVRNACFYASVKNYDTSRQTSAGETASGPHLFYFDAMEGVDIFGKAVVPEFYVDVSEQMDFKVEMLAQHVSQREWLRAQHGIDNYLNTMRAWAALRGQQAATVSGRSLAGAEAFRQHRGHAYPHSNAVGQLLSSRVILNPSY